MEEVKCPRNKLDIEVNVDTDEAQERIERLTQAAEKCTKAFEELGDAIASVGSLLNGNQAECAPIDIELALGDKKQLEEWINGCGPLEK
ncbi:hypothetical protein [Bacillus cereus]|uniref:hypothetical protein n=1 Tax=Bacillus cereus TaxID=1396 RepID=UPI00019FE4E7|nr:hypothetical protein [Bacillus cereus]EEK53360.1 hypothetical protein bcere0004_53560 [Bacillus cereus BGSC 6E1]